MSNPLERYKRIMAPDSRSCLTADEIQRYVRQDISEAERKIVEQHLVVCNLCAEAVEGAQLEGIEPVGEHLTSMHRRFDAQFTGKKDERARPRRVPLRFYYAVAAALVLTFSAIAYFTSRSPYDKVLSEYVKPYSNSVPLVRGDHGLLPLQDAMMSYESEDYESTARKLKIILAADPNNSTAEFYCGVSCLLLGDGGQAAVFLQKIDSQSDLYDAAQWYLALAFLEQKEIGQTKTVLKSIAVSSSPYAGAAREVLAKLK
jgi:hypothetical protein